LFRYALALFKSAEEDLLQESDYSTILNLLRHKFETSSDVKALTKVMMIFQLIIRTKPVELKETFNYFLVRQKEFFSANTL